jgi:dTDP-glucose 4,6-dehydratase
VFRERPECRIINLDLLTYAGNPENLAKDVETRNPLRYRFIQGDIADSMLIKRLFQEENIDAVVNFAAETHVDRSLIDSAPFLRTNVEGLRVLLEAAWSSQTKRFLQVSTDEVYGTLALGEPAFTEDNPLKPNSPYAASKAAADLLVRAYHRSYDVPALITRCGNNYGPYQFPEKFLPLVITNALEDRPVPLYGDGTQIRDWIHVEDHCGAILTVLEKAKPGSVYNIGGECELPNINIAKRILRELGHDRRDEAGRARRAVPRR